jgi:hypothetical protein
VISTVYSSFDTPQTDFPVRFVSGAITAYFHLQEYPLEVASYTAPTLNLVLVNHAAGDSQTGSVFVTINVTTPSNTPIAGITLVGYTFPPTVDDTYMWDPAHAIGNYSASWMEYNDDGVVLSGLPTTPFCVHLTVTSSTGLPYGLYFGSYDLMDRMILSQASTNLGSYSICQTTCTDPCSVVTSPLTCMSTPGCGYCSESDACMSGTNGGPTLDFCNTWRYSTSK